MKEESNRIGGRPSKCKCGMAGEIKSAEGKEIHKFQDKINNKQEAQRQRCFQNLWQSNRTANSNSSANVVPHPQVHSMYAATHMNYAI